MLSISLICCSIVLLPGVHAVLAAEPVLWHPTLSAAQTAATASNKPVLVVVFDPGDKTSRTLFQGLFAHEDVIALLRRFETVAADYRTEATQDFCNRYKVGTVRG